MAASMPTGALARAAAGDDGLTHERLRAVHRRVRLEEGALDASRTEQLTQQRDAERMRPLAELIETLEERSPTPRSPAQTPVPPPLASSFDDIDTDGDGVISKREWEAAHAGGLPSSAASTAQDKAYPSSSGYTDTTAPYRMHMAAAMGDVEVLDHGLALSPALASSRLLSCGLTSAHKGRTSLMTAAAAGDLGTTRALLQRNYTLGRGLPPAFVTRPAESSDVNAVDCRGWSALMHAASAGHGDVSLELCRAGADTSLRNRAGYDAEELARARVSSVDPRLGASSEMGERPHERLLRLIAPYLHVDARKMPPWARGGHPPTGTLGTAPTVLDPVTNPDPSRDFDEYLALMKTVYQSKINRVMDDVVNSDSGLAHHQHRAPPLFHLSPRPALDPAVRVADLTNPVRLSSPSAQSLAPTRTFPGYPGSPVGRA
jgi:hypothetical protein